MGALATRLAKVNAPVLAYNHKAAMFQEILLNYCVLMNVKANVLNVAEYVNRAHSGENCAMLYVQFCHENGFDVNNNTFEALK